MRRPQIILLCSLFLVPLLAQDKYYGRFSLFDKTEESIKPDIYYYQELIPDLSPDNASVKVYAPTPGNQGKYNNCVGWSSSYAARTIIFNKQRGITQSEEVNANAFSPAFTYRMISSDNSCFTPASIEEALKSMKEKGTVPKSSFDCNCSGPIPTSLYPKALSYVIEDYRRLFFVEDPDAFKILSVKSALANENPVIIGMKCTPSFERADGKELWKREETLHSSDFFGHAMCIVGYDNNKFGGDFEIMNCWGQKWGKGGFIWVRYNDFAHFTKYAFSVKDHQTSDQIAAKAKNLLATPPLQTDQMGSGQDVKDPATCP